MADETCPRCQYSVQQDHRFCPQCGASLQETPAGHDHDRPESWWERRPGWERALIIVIIAAVIVAVVYFVSAG
jgi:predicted amidophosphoribosyltransferase